MQVVLVHPAKHKLKHQVSNKHKVLEEPHSNKHNRIVEEDKLIGATDKEDAKWLRLKADDSYK
jgi:hypothetical protein